MFEQTLVIMHTAVLCSSSGSSPLALRTPTCTSRAWDAEPMVIDKVPFDKYELEPSPLTQYILERKSPHTLLAGGPHYTNIHFSVVYMG